MDGAFYYMQELESVTISPGVTEIGSDTFSECSKLTSVVIPDSVTSIGKNAFYNCTSLKSVTIPESVTSIGVSVLNRNTRDEGAFSGCTSLESVTIWSGAIGQEAFIGCNSLTKVTLQDGVTIIGESAFAGCPFTSLKIPGSVDCIKASAFKGCPSLSEVTISEGVGYIEESAFERCPLTSVTIPASVTCIEDYAFKDCKNLESVTIEGTPYIFPNAFEGCDDLTVINAPAGVRYGSKYTVHFDPNGGEPTPSVQFVKSGDFATEPAEPIKAGYTFEGWYALAGDGSSDYKFDFDKKPITSNVDLYARWTSTTQGASYNVSFDANGGSGSMDAQIVEDGTELVLPANGFTPPEGMQFACWAIGKLDGRQVSAGYRYVAMEDTTIYALWEQAPIPVYTVTYDANGGTGSTQPDTVEKGKTLRLPANEFTAPEGKRFKCWTVGDVQGTRVNAGYPYAFSTDTVVYALWEEIPVAPTPIYTVTFDTDGGSRIASQEVEEGKKLTRPGQDPAKTGHTFAGWYSDASCTSEYDFNTAVSKNMTIYAKWEEIPVIPPAPAVTYTVTYDANGGTGSMEMDIVEEGKALRLPANEFTAPEGKKFKCWAVGSLEGTKKGAGSKCAFEADMTVYAVWEDVEKISVPMKKVRFTGFKSSFVYTGKEATQGDMKLIYNGETLVESVDGGESGDYTVTYTNNISVGKATVEYKGVNKYSGTDKKTFKITPYNMASDSEKRLYIDPEEIEIPYLKGGSKPSIKLYDGDILLEEGKDYVLSYKNNTKVKEVSEKNAPTVIVKGKGNYKGTLKEKKTFTITAKDLSSVSIAAKDVQASTKKGKYKSVPVLTDVNGKKLKAGTDYLATYVYTYKNDSTVKNKGNDVIRNAGDAVDAYDIVPAGTVLCVTVRAKEKSNYEGAPVTAEYSIY